MTNLKEASFFVRDGVTYYLKDERAREMLAELIASSEEKYGPDNPPPYPVTSVNNKTGAVTLGKSDVGLGNVDNIKQYSSSNPPPYPVTSVNNKTGAVSLGKSDVGLGNVDNVRQYSSSNPPPYPVTSVNGQTGAASLGKSDVGLGSVDNIKQYSADNPPPYPVTSVNGQTGAASLGKSDVGLGSVDNVRQYSASNPPPYPVTSVNGQTGAVTVPTVTLPLSVSEGGTGGSTASEARANLSIPSPFVNFGAKIGSDIVGPGQSATPSQDCFCVVLFGATSGTAATVSINGVLVASTLIQTTASATYPVTATFYIKAGQTVSTRNVTGQAYVMRFYALYTA